MKKLIFISLVTGFLGCQLNENKSDAYGNFEAVETIISSEAAGKILLINAEEGSVIEEGLLVAVVDTTDLLLKKDQLSAQKKAIESRSSSVFAQIEVQKQQRDNLLIDKARIEKLLKEGAATQKQLDDIIGNLNLIDKQISSIESQNSAVISEMAVIDKQIEQLNENIKKCYIKNPVKGTVLQKYVEQYELIGLGKPIYKIADISFLNLKAYVSGSQLPLIKLGQKVKIFVDGPDKSLSEHEGEITWIASEAEFTPKIIQTKEERVNLVYAIKVKTKNDGTLKIGMPAEVQFK